MPVECPKCRFENSDNSRFCSHCAAPLALAGDKPHALEWLERGYEARDPNLPYLRQPQYDFLRSEPRFQEIFRRMQLQGDEQK